MSGLTRLKTGTGTNQIRKDKIVQVAQEPYIVQLLWSQVHLAPVRAPQLMTKG